MMKDWMARWWLDAIMGGALTLLGFAFSWSRKKLKAAHNENDALKAGIKALLRDRIVQGYHMYIELGYWPIHARDSALEMHEQYHALGGNGTVKQLMDALSKLPTDKERKVDVHGA